MAGGWAWFSRFSQVLKGIPAGGAAGSRALWGLAGDSGNREKWQWRGRAGSGCTLRLGLGLSWGFTWPPCSC